MMSNITVELALFYTFSFVMIGAAFGVIWHRNPIKSALFLVIFFVTLAATYALIGADFLATLQILIYVGAIMVLFLFVIMLISIRDTNFENFGLNAPRSLLIFFLVVAFLLQFFVLINAGHHNQTSISQSINSSINISQDKMIKGNTEIVSYSLFKFYLLPFEVVSILLLVAVIGAVMLAKKDRRKLQ